MRAPWFAVSCCPPNVARTLASLAAYVATVDDDGVQLHQYAPSRIRTSLRDGRRIALDVATDYPPTASSGSSYGRVPRRMDAHPAGPVVGARGRCWWKSSRRPVDHPDRRAGTAGRPGRSAAGDVVELHLPVAPRFTAADPRVDAVRGCRAVERGPEVLCLESVDFQSFRPDQPPVDLSSLTIDPDIAPRDQDGRVVVRVRLEPDPPTAAWPYPGSAAETQARSAEWVDVPLVPYHGWANRGPSTMRVWLPVSTSC